MNAQRGRFTLAALLAANALLASRKARQPSPRTRALLERRLPAARALYGRGHTVMARHRRRGTGTAGKAAQAQSGLPDFLRWLIQLLMDVLGRLFGQLESGDITPDQWSGQVETNLADYHLAAFMAGQGDDQVPAAALDKLADQVSVQLGYLAGFKAEVQSAPEFKAGWNARAQSYASSVKQPYWFGATGMLPLPAMPAQGTQCGNNCLCTWQIEWLNHETLSANAKWVRSAKDSCQTCIQREAEWGNIQIRDGVLL